MVSAAFLQGSQCYEKLKDFFPRLSLWFVRFSIYNIVDVHI
jgi:hypothetical protein